ncbi:MAG: leucine-rich repeat protein [Eubacterium sp.]|nr:leucine-rich repeat protein [Eubacterium sp.]
MIAIMAAPLVFDSTGAVYAAGGEYGTLAVSEEGVLSVTGTNGQAAVVPADITLKSGVLTIPSQYIFKNVYISGPSGSDITVKTQGTDPLVVTDELKYIGQKNIKFESAKIKAVYIYLDGDSDGTNEINNSEIETTHYSFYSNPSLSIINSKVKTGQTYDSELTVYGNLEISGSDIVVDDGIMCHGSLNILDSTVDITGKNSHYGYIQANGADENGCCLLIRGSKIKLSTDITSLGGDILIEDSEVDLTGKYPYNWSVNTNGVITCAIDYGDTANVVITGSTINANGGIDCEGSLSMTGSVITAGNEPVYPGDDTRSVFTVAGDISIEDCEINATSYVEGVPVYATNGKMLVNGQEVSDPSSVNFCRVTFKAVNGKFADGKTSVARSLLSGQKIDAGKIPAVTPDQGYAAGSWDKDPSAQTISSDITFTYTCTALQPAVGTVITDTATGYKYKVTVKGKQVAFCGLSGAVKKVKMPASVTLKGTKYTVTSVAKNALKKNKKVTSVVIGSNVETIGATAFSGCTKLTSVTIGKKVKAIKAGAFKGSKKLKKITIKTTKLTTKKVGKKAFTGIYKKAVFKVPAKKLKAYKTLLKKKGAPKKAVYKK